ncbi:hypothetical protein PUNSTDRAFT_137683 [Punctularia strigosozonata HHB-11173 SS5]|uniref:uncharacterized protein n=1 Tax=Punctularia strigosozonata (strain HHB-11173) TaxID=741275 RepID=UPI00044182E3|nr:uncharacterized protein PUNSTDRAFT_137683 [Punctularia strigosozonata HHB-11173 SS5]EIN05579.1 hypothetical protein PUNSTDRAFT_137683 [Punctularia strigosozonata HHB-11173 SS5]
MVGPSPEELAARPDNYATWNANDKRKWTNSYRKSNPPPKDTTEDSRTGRATRAGTSKSGTQKVASEKTDADGNRRKRKRNDSTGTVNTGPPKKSTRPIARRFPAASVSKRNETQGKGKQKRDRNEPEADDDDPGDTESSDSDDDVEDEEALEDDDERLAMLEAYPEKLRKNLESERPRFIKTSSASSSSAAPAKKSTKATTTSKTRSSISAGSQVVVAEGRGLGYSQRGGTSKGKEKAPSRYAASFHGSPSADDSRENTRDKNVDGEPRQRLYSPVDKDSDRKGSSNNDGLENEIPAGSSEDPIQRRNGPPTPKAHTDRNSRTRVGRATSSSGVPAKESSKATTASKTRSSISAGSQVVVAEGRGLGYSQRGSTSKGKEKAPSRYAASCHDTPSADESRGNTRDKNVDGEPQQRSYSPVDEDSDREGSSDKDGLENGLPTGSSKGSIGRGKGQATRTHDKLRALSVSAKKHDHRAADGAANDSTTADADANDNDSSAIVAVTSSKRWPSYTNVRSRPGEKPGLHDQRAELRRVVKAAMNTYFGYLVAVDAYPDPATRQMVIKGLLKRAAGKLLEKQIADRINNDRTDWMRLVIGMIENRVSQFRSKVKKAANEYVLHDYDITDGCGPRAIAWSQNNAYIFPGDVEDPGSLKKGRPYDRPVFAQVIREAFFSGRCPLASQNPQIFGNEEEGEELSIPIAMLAFAAVGVLSIIQDWTTGKKKQRDFAQDTFVNTYKNHIATLEGLEIDKPRYFDQLMTSLYVNASDNRRQGGTAFSDVDMSAIES